MNALALTHRDPTVTFAHAALAAAALASFVVGGLYLLGAFAC